MKKFSKITNYKIKEEPEIEHKIDEAEEFKSKMINLMNQFLKVQSYGAVDNRYLNGKVKVEGKELLAEALLNLFTDNSNKKQKSILESLKSEVKDWKSIDNKIESIKESSIDAQTKLKFYKILERYDEESLVLFFENKSNQINKSTKVKYSKLLQESNLSKEVKNKINNFLL